MRHANFGAPGVGTDVHYLVLRRALEHLTPKLVVVHAFDNDVSELGRYYRFCGGALIDYEQPELRWTCPERRRNAPLTPGIIAPYALRVATEVSFAARHLAALFHRTERWDEHPLEVEHERQRKLLAAIAQLAKARGIELRFHLMPSRAWLEGELSGGKRYLEALMQRSAKELGVELLESQPVFARALAENPEAQLFVPRDGDPHLSPEGAALLADWLAEVL